MLCSKIINYIGLLQTFNNNEQLRNKIICSVNSHILVSN